MSYNLVKLIGNVGGEPKVKYLDSETCSAQFSLATNTEHIFDEYGRMSGDIGVDWHQIVCYRDLAKWVEVNVRSGVLLRVSGRLTYREYRTQYGERYKFAYIMANNIEQLAKQEEVLPDAHVHVEAPTDPYGRFLDKFNQDSEDIPF